METDNIDDLGLRRRRLRYRAWHRGMREMDFMLGHFVDAVLPALNEDEMTQIEVLLEAPDPDLFAWVLGQAAVPPGFDTPMFRRLAAFHGQGSSAP